MDILFYLHEQGVELVQDTGRKEGMSSLFFSWEDKEAIEQLLIDISPKSQVGIIIDFVDENIENHWLPKLMPWEKGVMEKRQALKAKAEGALLVNTHWEQNFRKTKEGRQEQSLRIISLANSDNLTDFFEKIEEHFVSLIRIYTVSELILDFFHQDVQKKFKYNKKQLKKPLLLLVRESSHIFRQVILHDKNILITRLIEIDPDIESEEAIALVLIEQSHLAIKYLYNQKTLPYNIEVGLFYLDSSIDMTALVKTIFMEKISLPSWDHEQVIIESTTFNKIQKKVLVDAVNPFLLIISKFAFSKKPRGTYQIPYSEKINQLLLTQKFIIWSLIFGGVIGVILNGQYLLDNMVLNKKNDILNQKRLSFNLEKKHISDKLKITSNAEDMRQIVLFSQKVLQDKKKYQLGFDIEGLSHILQNNKHIQVTELKWQHLGTFDQAKFSIKLSGLVFPFVEKYANPVKWVDQLVSDLKQLKGAYKIVLVKAPLDRNLARALTISETQKKVNSLPFEIDFEVENAKKQK